MNTVLDVSDLTKRFGERVVLRSVELQLCAGMIYHLSGRNGAGKSTLLKLIAGLDVPDSGRVRFEEGTWAWRKALARLRQEVTYVHQSPFMFDGSVETNLLYGMRATGLSKATQRRRTEQALRHLGLEQLRRRHARTLSGGEKQWVALARAWVLQPRILLLDEPTTNMDLESREQTAFLLRRLTDERLCIVITSHDPEVLSSLATSRLHLEQGCLREQDFGMHPAAQPAPDSQTHEYANYY